MNSKWKAFQDNLEDNKQKSFQEFFRQWGKKKKQKKTTKDVGLSESVVEVENVQHNEITLHFRGKVIRFIVEISQSV